MKQIFGDIDRDKALSLIKTNFEDWEAKEIPQVVVNQEPSVKSERLREEKEDFKEEMRDICENVVGEEELREAKNYFLGQKFSEMQRSSSYGFNCSLYELYGIGAEETDRLSERIDQITLDSLKTTASSYLNLNKCVVVILKGE